MELSIKELKKIILLLSIILPAISSETVFAQNKINPNGWNTFRYGNGTISSEGEMKDGKPEGYWKTYFVNGKLKSEGNRRNHLLADLWIFYDEKGDTIKKINYRAGIKSGFMLIYQKTDTAKNKKNIPLSKELYLNNQKHGAAYYYNEKGGLIKKVYYENGKKEGAAKEYNDKGTVISLIEYQKNQIVKYEPINRTDAKGRKQGTWKKLYQDDKVKEEANYLDDKLHGYLKKFSETGRITSIVRYEHGKIINTENNKAQKSVKKETYYADGKLKTSGSFINETPIGTHRRYKESGEIEKAVVYDSLGVKLSEGIFDKSGKKQGEWIFYYSNNAIKAKGEYKDDKKTGKWKFFFENGKIEQEGKYRKGKKDASWTWYYPATEIRKQEIFYNGELEGLYIEFTKTGDTITTGQYIAGLKEGEWYYHVGDHTETGEYKFGQKTGEWKHFFPNGRLKFKGEFTNGKPNNKHIYYYSNGNIRLKAFYKDGSREKNWDYFYETGIPRISIKYKNDKEIKVDGRKI